VKKFGKILRAFLMLTFPSLLIGMGIGAYPGYKTYEYTWKDANFCISCHVHDYATYSWEESSHGQATTCHDCHHQPLHQYIKEAYVYVTKRPVFPKDLHHTPNVPSDLCQSCHLSAHADRSTITGPLAKENLAHVPKVDKLYLHAFHLERKTKLTLLKSHQLSDEERMGQFVNPKVIKQDEERAIACSDCHGGPTNRAHHFSAVDLSCVRCHGNIHRSPMGQEYGCRNCHFQEFLLPLDNSAR